MEVNKRGLTLLNPAPDKCQVCATDHDPNMPHNLHSLYYQTKFYLENCRHPTWEDAMAHCNDKVKTVWTQALEEIGEKAEGVTLQ